MENKEQTGLIAHEQPSSTLSIFSNKESFEHSQRVAVMLSNSTIVPAAYQNNPANCLVALEMAGRMKDSPLMIMQNLDVIFGRPSFNAKFIASKINTCGQFSALRFRYTGEGDNKSCVAYATETATGNVLDGPTVSIAMAKAQGWYTRKDSKWPSMPDMMLMYRAATYFGRMYAPELTMGMQSVDEMQDTYSEVTIIEPNPASASPGESIGNLNSVVAEKQPNEPAPKAQPGKRTAKAAGKTTAASPAEPKKEEQPEIPPAQDHSEQQPEMPAALFPEGDEGKAEKEELI